MIRLEGALGPTIALAEQSHDQQKWVVVRTLGVVASVVGMAYWVLATAGLAPADHILLGLSQITVGVGIGGAIYELYHHVHLKNLLPTTSLSEQAASEDWLVRINLADYISWEVGRILLLAQTAPGQFAMEPFLRGLLAEDTTGIFFARAGLTGPIDETKAASGRAPTVQSPVTSVEPLLQYAAVKAVEAGHRRIHVSHILMAMAEYHQGFVDLLFAHNVEPDDLIEAIGWYERTRKRSEHHFFWERGKVGIWGIGRDWAAGYTPTLSKFAIDLARYYSNRDQQSQIVGRTAVILQIEQVLASERRSNVILVGLPGVGKKTVVNGVAARIAAGDAPRTLANKHVMELDVGALLAGVSDRGQLEERLLRVLRDVSQAGNIILFINNIHTLFAAEAGKLGSINASDVLLPFLRSGRIQLIGATTPADYHGVLAPQGAIASAFRRIDLEEPSPEEAVVLVEDVALYLEARYSVFVPVPTIRKAVFLAQRYIRREPLPESAVRVMEAAAIRVTNERGKYITTGMIETIVTELAKVPVGDLHATEKDRLINLETVLHGRVIGQDEAITAIASAMRRARSGLNSGSRPIGSFLFLGPTGVGKTETARALAEAYFGAEQAMIRLDMSEFQSPASLARLIGAPTEAQGAGSGQLTSAVRDTPFALILLDEIEKAHPDILNIFLAVLEDGRLSDGRGEAVDFSNSIIIATSNAGSEFIRTQVTQGVPPEQFKEALLDHIQSTGQFRPEFLNRFDAVVAFKPLLPDQLLRIVDLLLKGLNKRLVEEKLTVELTEPAKVKLAELGYKPEFGARALRRVLQDKVENIVADKLLVGAVNRGDTLVIDVPDLGDIAAPAAPIDESPPQPPAQPTT